MDSRRVAQVAIFGALTTATVVLLAAACAPTAGPAKGWARAGATPAHERAGLRLQWASTEYFSAGPADPVVEVRVIIDNQGSNGTESTSILWEPAFAQSFTFLRSDPPAWRVRVDDQGWGVFDGSGTLPRQFNTFRLWFVANAMTVLEPRLKVVANGHLVVAETSAGATHLRAQAAAPAQRTFERGLVAAAADAVPFLPADARGAFPVAMGMGVALAAMVGIGGVAAFRLAGRGNLEGEQGAMGYTSSQPAAAPAND